MQREVRKTVSVVFSDVAGSTALAERLDPESLRLWRAGADASQPARVGQ